MKKLINAQLVTPRGRRLNESCQVKSEAYNKVGSAPGAQEYVLLEFVLLPVNHIGT